MDEVKCFEAFMSFLHAEYTYDSKAFIDFAFEFWVS